MILRPRGERLKQSIEALVNSPHINFETVDHDSPYIKFRELRRQQAKPTTSEGSYNRDIYVVRLRIFTDVKWEELHELWNRLMGKRSNGYGDMVTEFGLKPEDYEILEGFRYDYPVSLQPRGTDSRLPIILYCDVYTARSLEAFENSGGMVQETPFRKDQEKIRVRTL